jgi:hypothetical protein
MEGWIMLQLRITSRILIGVLVITAVMAGMQVTPAAAQVIYVSGNITTNTTWSSGNIYVVEGHVTVNSGVTLTVQEGVIIKFADNKMMGVNGVLKVVGVLNDPVIMTSLKDDTAGGDTNGDGNSTSPSPGDWGHIAFFDSSVDAENLIEHADIRYGGHFNNGSNSYYSNCWNCEYWSVIRLSAASPTLRYNDCLR